MQIISLVINNINYHELIAQIRESIEKKKKLFITGANAHIVNLTEDDFEFRKSLKNFDIIHPDGIGVFWASKFLYGKNGMTNRINGSDFYEHLISYCQQSNISIYFFGDKQSTLELINLKQPHLNIAGFNSGYNFNDKDVIEKINAAKPDILIVGLGSGKQEKWIALNGQKINVNIIIAVGDGIKVFAGTKKRGPKVFRQLGFEWLIRFFYEPKRLWKRYFIGNPLFILRVVRFKFLGKQNQESQ